MVYSPLSVTQIPTLFFLSETILYWLKNDAVLEPFLTSTELKLLKVRERKKEIVRRNKILLYRLGKSFFNYYIFIIWKVNQRIFVLHWYILFSLGSTGAYEEFKIRLYTYLEGRSIIFFA